MSDPRLKSRLWIQAGIRALATDGIIATVARRGDPDAGALLIKQNFMDGRFRVLSRARTATGALAWQAGTGESPVDEPRVDAYIAREIDRDYDLWVLEIEDRNGRLPFGETPPPGFIPD